MKYACRRQGSKACRGRGICRFDTAESVCTMLTDSVALGYNIFEYFECISKITPEDVLKRLSVFSRENAVLSVINPIKKSEE